MKKIIYYLLFILPIIVAAQAPSIAWQKRIGSSNSEIVGGDVHKTSDGGFIFGGRSNSDAYYEKTENSRGGSDYWIVKTDSSGNIEWDKTIGGAQLNGFPSYENDALQSVVQTPDGGFFLCGDSSSPISGEKTENCRGDYDIWVLKLSATKTIEWQRTLGGSLFETGSIAIKTLDGGFLISCSSLSNNSGEKTDDCRGNYDIWILKLSANGVIEWQETIGGSLGDSARSVLQNTDGTYILAGGSSSNISGEKTENSRGNGDIWLLKLDALGNILQQKTIGGSENDTANKIILTNDGNYFVTAVSSSPISGEKTEYCRGGNDIWLLKVDPSFNIIWQKTYGGNADDAGYGLQCFDNGYFISGNSQSGISGEKLTPVSGYTDAWILKLNEIGDIQWQKTIGGNAPGIYSGQDGFVSALQMTDGSYVMFGTTNSNVSGDIVDFPRGKSDFWLVKLNPDNLSTENFENSKTNIFPNPTTGFININFDQALEKVTLTLTNVLGQVVSSKIVTNLENTTYEINESNGIYFLEIATINNEKQIFKIVKQ